MKCFIGVFLVLFSNCSTNKNLKTYSVTSYKEVPTGYQYSNELITFKSKLYKPIIYAEYRMDTLVSVKLYKSEGAVLYSKSELDNDQLLKKSLEVYDVRPIEVEGKYVKDRGNEIEIAEQTNKVIYCIIKNELIIYKL